MEPFDYTMMAQNPVSAMQEGMAFGQQQRAGEQNMQLAQQQEQRAQTQFGQQTQLFDQGQQDRAMQLKAAMDARASAERQQQDLVGLARKIGAGGATYADFAAVSAQHPEMISDIQKMWEGQSAERKDADKANVYKAAAAIKSGNPQIAIEMLNERADAAEAGGDKQEADFSRAMAAGIKADPNAGLVGLGLILQSIDENANASLFGGGTDAIPADVQSLQWRAKEAGLTPGSEEYKAFIAAGGKSGGGEPASFQALKLQAEAAGLVEGSPEYQEFMATKGAGLVAAAKTDATAKAEAGINLPDIIAKSQSALDLINSISSDPSLEDITGIVQGNMPAGVPLVSGGQAGADLNAKIDQLKGKAFLEAFTALKGAGAISEGEGEKATNAIAALSRKQSAAAYRASLKELSDVIEGSIERAKQKAGNSGSPPPQSDEDPIALKWLSQP